MRFLIDENIHTDFVSWLRSRGQDVAYAAELSPGLSDERLLALAERERRILVSDDKDFGELVFRRGLVCPEVILLRLGNPSIDERIRRMEEVWQVIQRKAPGHFVVIAEERIRIRPLGRRGCSFLSNSGGLRPLGLT